MTKEEMKAILQQEGCNVGFQHAGFNCLCTRGPLGVWCGYVAVPPDHPFYGLSYNEDTVIVDFSFKDKIKERFLYSSDEEAQQIILSLQHRKWDARGFASQINKLLKAHGGITYTDDKVYVVLDEESEPGWDVIRPVTRYNIEGKWWWIGFDTMHAYDLSPFNVFSRPYSLYTPEFIERHNVTYKNKDSVKDWTKHLAEQLKEITPYIIVGIRSETNKADEDE